MAAQKTPVSGLVVALSTERKAFKVGDKWYRISSRSENLALPARGASINFDAYGEQQDIVYRFNVQGELGESNGNGGSGSGSSSSAGNPVRADSPGGGPRTVALPGRAVALQAAATLLAGSEGNVEQVASNVVAIARVFEAFLAGGNTIHEDELL